MKASAAVAVAVLLGGIWGCVHADTFVYSGDTTGLQEWNRPLADLSGLSPVGTAVPYGALDFWVDVSGIYDFENTSGDHPDPMLFLYHVRLNPTSPLQNALAGDDDSAGSYRPLLSGISLTAWEQYTLVTTGFQNFDVGTFTNQIDGPGAVTAETIPEPGTALLLGLGIGLLALRPGRLRAAT